MEASGQPGSARFGNFINYYCFNPAAIRLQLLPDAFLRDHCMGGKGTPIVCLDIGCNAGELTSKLHIHLKESCEHDHEVQMLGVDLDPVLISRSQETNHDPKHLTYQMADLMNEEHRTQIIQAHLDKFNQKSFHLVSCFSVTMWVHLNHGDSGLQNFLEYISGICQFLLIELQPWKCYKTAVRRMQKLKCEPFIHFEKLNWRDKVDQNIKDYLKTHCNMVQVNEFGQTKWGRSLCVFKSVC